METMTIQPSLFEFDYSVISPEKRGLIQDCANEIRMLAKRSAEDILRMGELLHLVKAELGHGNFGNWIELEFGWSWDTANRLMKVYDKFRKLRNLEMFDPSALYLLSQNNTPDKAVDEALELAESGEYISHQLAKELVDDNRTDRALYSSNSNEWYTPNGIIFRVLQVLQVIDLDPCSNSKDEPNVPAANHYTQEDDGLNCDWFGRVYMNPPYGREIELWIDRLVNEYNSGSVIEAITLVPSRTDTAWFRRLRDFPHCFVWGRLKFSDNGTPAPFPSMAVYLGGNNERFIDAFKDIGDIYVRVQ